MKSLRPVQNVTISSGSVVVSEISSSSTVTGPLTDAELRVADVKVSLDSEIVAINGGNDADVKVTLDSEAVTIDNTADIKVTLDSEQVAISNFPATQEVSDNPYETWVSGTLTLTDADTAYKIPASEQSGRRILYLYNGSDSTIILGASTITTAGYPIVAGATLIIAAGANLYAACAGAGKILTYLEGK